MLLTSRCGVAPGAILLPLALEGHASAFENIAFFSGTIALVEIFTVLSHRDI
jgi:hypothetical protein